MRRPFAAELIRCARMIVFLAFESRTGRTVTNGKCETFIRTFRNLLKSMGWLTGNSGFDLSGNQLTGSPFVRGARTSSSRLRTSQSGYHLPHDKILAPNWTQYKQPGRVSVQHSKIQKCAGASQEK